MPTHRHGGVILALWGALAEFMTRNQLDTMIGCASIPMLHNGVASGHAAASIWRQVKQTHLAPIEYQVPPRLPLPVEAARRHAGRRAAGPDQGLPAPGRQGARPAGLGPGLQQRGPADADANPRPAAALPQALPGLAPDAHAFDASGRHGRTFRMPRRRDERWIPYFRHDHAERTRKRRPLPQRLHLRPAPGHAGLPGGGAARLPQAHPSDYLYLVGDIVDGWQLRRRWYWPQAHNDVVQKLLRSARKGCRVIYVPGNHDEFARHFVGHQFGGIEVLEEAVHVTADGRQLWVIHGDYFDGVVQCAKWLAYLGDNAL